MGRRAKEEKEEAWVKVCGLMDILHNSKTVIDDMNKFVPEILGQMWSDVMWSTGANRASLSDIINKGLFFNNATAFFDTLEKTVVFEPLNFHY